MSCDCPTCHGTGMTADEQEICEPCDGAGVIEGTREELFSAMRWGACIVLLVLRSVIEAVR